MGDDSKVWWQSKGMWGGIVAIVASVIAIVLHRTISDAQQAQIVDLIFSVVTALSGVLAVYGRASATQEVTLRKK
jgi:anti-sigma-K factor RskA